MGLQIYHLQVQSVLKSGSLELLEPSEPAPGLYRDCFTRILHTQLTTMGLKRVCLNEAA